MLVCALASLCLAGCGNGGDSDYTIVIGGIGPTTGVAATYGTAVKNGAQLAVNEINAAGGINGMQIKYLFEDDAHNPETAVNAYNTLMDKGMQILMGTVTSKPCIAVAEVAHEDNIFQITPSGSAVECIKYDNAFRICFNDPDQGTASAQYIKEQNLAQKIAIIYDKSDVYSTGITEKFEAKAAELGLNIVAKEAFTSSSATDFSAQLQNIKDAGADLVFLPIYYEAAASILTQSKSAGLDTKFFGCDGLDGVIAQLGEENAAAAEGVMLLTPFVATAEDAKTKKFSEDYKAAYGEMPNQFAADAYDAIYTIKAACEKADIKGDMSVSAICDKLKAAMLQIEITGLTGKMTWSANGEPNKEPKAMKIVNGIYEAM